jgi:hypothetical protein
MAGPRRAPAPHGSRRSHKDTRLPGAMATRNPNMSSAAALAAAKRAAAGAAAEGGAAAGEDAELFGPRGEWWWTGRKPWECPGFDAEAGVLR